MFSQLLEVSIDPPETNIASISGASDHLLMWAAYCWGDISTSGSKPRDLAAATAFFRAAFTLKYYNLHICLPACKKISIFLSNYLQNLGYIRVHHAGWVKIEKTFLGGDVLWHSSNLLLPLEDLRREEKRIVDLVDESLAMIIPRQQLCQEGSWPCQHIRADLYLLVCTLRTPSVHTSTWLSSFQECPFNLQNTHKA